MRYSFFLPCDGDRDGDRDGFRDGDFGNGLFAFRFPSPLPFPLPLDFPLESLSLGLLSAAACAVGDGVRARLMCAYVQRCSFLQLPFLLQKWQALGCLPLLQPLPEHFPRRYSTHMLLCPPLGDGDLCGVLFLEDGLGVRPYELFLVFRCGVVFRLPLPLELLR